MFGTEPLHMIFKSVFFQKEKEGGGERKLINKYFAKYSNFDFVN